MGGFPKEQRRQLARLDADRIDPLCLEKIDEIWTTLGTKRLRLEIVPDDGMPGDAGRTVYDGAEILIEVPRHLRQRAFLGDGTARFAVARELGHATLHLNALLEKVAQPRPLFEKVMGGCSSHWQAGLFAAGFLVDETAWQLPSPEAISVRCGIGVSQVKNLFNAYRLGSFANRSELQAEQDRR